MRKCQHEQGIKIIKARLSLGLCFWVLGFRVSVTLRTVQTSNSTWGFLRIQEELPRGSYINICECIEPADAALGP